MMAYMVNCQIDPLEILQEIRTMADIALERRINVMVQVWCYWIARDLTKKLQGTKELHEMIKEKLDTECQEVRRHIQNREC